MEDEKFMHRALELAKKGRGFVSPNPLVGAVIVKKGRIIAEGYHPSDGAPHAETIAFDNASEPVRGGTLYSTLEPCSHSTATKRHPPCARRIIDEGIVRVVIAQIDPNPDVNGNGVEQLRASGIDVVCGVLGKEAVEINEIYTVAVSLSRPFIHLKAAATLDGFIAGADGASRWISDDKARRNVHQWRGEYDAVMVGGQTARQDDPRLTVRHGEGKNPVRIILSTRGSINKEAALFEDDAPVILFHGEQQTPTLPDKENLLTIPVPQNETGLDLNTVAQRLYNRGIRSVLAEGGSALFTSLIREKLWDRLSLFTAPLILGAGTPLWGELGIANLQEATRLRWVRIREIGDQVFITGRSPESLCSPD